jgi:transcriptional regulator with XRE-family HTH domain
MTNAAVPEWTVRHRLQMAREYAELDQAGLARKLNVSRNTVSNYERGMVAPARALVAAWALATGVDREWIERGETERSEADDLVDQIARLVLSRARRDSNPQPSDLESWTVAA